MNLHHYNILVGINAPYEVPIDLDLVHDWVKEFANAAGRAHLIPSGTITCQATVHDDASITLLLDLPQLAITADPMDAIGSTIVIHFTGKRVLDSFVRIEQCARTDQGDDLL